MNEASTPDFKADIRRLIAYCENQMKKLSVRVVMGDATEDALPSFDAVVAATGSHPITIQVPGYDRKNVRTAADVLNGAPCPGKRVVIIGGGSVGAETGIWLAEQGKEVTIVEMREGILLDEMAATKIVDLGMIQELGITLLPSHTLERIDEAGVTVRDLPIPVYPAGDTKRPRRIYDAIHEGYTAALQI